MKKAITLIELVIVMLVISTLILGISATSLFFMRHISYNIERYNIYGQINYALEDLKLRCLSASYVNSTFPEDGNITHAFEFIGENDIHALTPENLTDNVAYRYEVDSGSGDLVLLKNDAVYEVLVEAAYKPQLNFEYRPGDPPNVMKTTITAEGTKIPFSGVSNVVLRTETLRFWFVDIVE